MFAPPVCEELPMSRARWTRQPEPDRRPASGVDQSDPSAVRLDDAREVANRVPCLNRTARRSSRLGETARRCAGDLSRGMPVPVSATFTSTACTLARATIRISALLGVRERVLDEVDHPHARSGRVRDRWRTACVSSRSACLKSELVDHPVTGLGEPSDLDLDRSGRGGTCRSPSPTAMSPLLTRSRS